MGSPFISSGTGALDSLGFMSRLAKRREQVWGDSHVSPRTAPSKRAKLCTYHHWFSRPSNLRFEPYFELPMGIRKEGRKEITHPWQPTKLNGWNSVCVSMA